MYPQGKAVPTRTKFQGIGVGGAVGSVMFLHGMLASGCKVVEK